MVHNSYNYFWKGSIRPWFLYGIRMGGIPPDKEELTDNMKDSLLKYVYERETLKDFFQWAHQQKSVGSIEWQKYLSSDKGAPVCTPTPGLITNIITMLLYHISAFGVLSFSIYTALNAALKFQHKFFRMRS